MGPTGGSNSEGAFNYALNCPPGAFVTGLQLTTVTVNAGGNEIRVVESVGPLTCSQGEQAASAFVPDPLPEDAHGCSTDIVESAKGYTAIELRAGFLLDGVAFTPRTGARQPETGFYGDDGGDTLDPLACPAGSVITGLFGCAVSTNVIRFGLRCRAVPGRRQTLQRAGRRTAGKLG